MRARGVWFAGPRRVEVRAEDVREPGEHEVLIETVTSLISAGTEMLLYRGEIPTAEELALDRPGRGGTFPFPAKYGYQVAGRVAAAGPGAVYEVGAPVFAVHPHQDRFVLDARPGISNGANLVYPVPAELPLERAAFTNLYGVALNAMLDAPVRVGDCVVVAGLGLVGLFLADMARVTAARLILVDPVDARRSAAAGIGADAVVAPGEAARAIADLTDGRGADLYFEASGAPPALQAAITGTGQDGTVVVVSYYGTRQVQLLLAPEFHYRRIRVVSTQAGRINPELTPRWSMPRRVAVAMDRLRGVDLDLVSHRFALADAGRAYETVDRPEGDVRGVLLTYGAS